MLKSNYIYILRYILNNNNYNKYINNININKEDKELLFLYSCLKNLHEELKRDITLNEFVLYVDSKCSAKDYVVVQDLLEQLLSCELDDSLVESILVDIRNKQLAYNLALTALEVHEGRGKVEDLYEQLETFERKKQDETFEFVTTNLEELYEQSVKQQGLRWRLGTLNRMLGSLRRGDFGFIFARPETGKTTFLASEITCFASQSSGPILWFNNEEQGSKVMLRCYQAMLGCTLPELFSDLQGNKAKFNVLGGEHIRIFDSASIHRRQVEQLCKELSPALIVFDQIDKIKGFADDREDLRLGAIYIWARELAKTYCPVIGVSQADASGEGKRWLTMENVANAKTAKQAEADWILGIGKTHDTALEYVRHLHLSKNKLTGDEDTLPEYRHGKLDVIIAPEIARYKDQG